MKKLVMFLSLAAFGATAAQVDVSAGMGLNYFAAPSFTDYINANFAGASQLSTFQSSVEFLGEADYTLKKNYQVGLEYAMNIYSFNNNLGGLGYYDISYNLHKPTVVAYYVIPGEGYKFKFGGGAGVRILSLNEKLPNYTNGEDYSSVGFGVVLKASGMTTLGGNLYALIDVELRYDFNGEPSDGGKKIFDNTIQSNVNLNSLSTGLVLGVAYSF